MIILHLKRLISENFNLFKQNSNDFLHQFFSNFITNTNFFKQLLVKLANNNFFFGNLCIELKINSRQIKNFQATKDKNELLSQHYIVVDDSQTDISG